MKKRQLEAIVKELCAFLDLELKECPGEECYGGLRYGDSSLGQCYHCGGMGYLLEKK